MPEDWPVPESTNSLLFPPLVPDLHSAAATTLQGMLLAAALQILVESPAQHPDCRRLTVR